MDPDSSQFYYVHMSHRLSQSGHLNNTHYHMYAHGSMLNTHCWLAPAFR